MHTYKAYPNGGCAGARARFLAKKKRAHRRALQQDRMEKAETRPRSENANRKAAQERIPENLLT
jgi:hypothetical protein